MEDKKCKHKNCTNLVMTESDYCISHFDLHSDRRVTNDFVLRVAKITYPDMDTYKVKRVQGCRWVISASKEVDGVETKHLSTIEESLLEYIVKIEKYLMKINHI